MGCARRAMCDGGARPSVADGRGAAVTGRPRSREGPLRRGNDGGARRDASNRRREAVVVGWEAASRPAAPEGRRPPPPPPPRDVARSYRRSCIARSCVHVRYARRRAKSRIERSCRRSSGGRDRRAARAPATQLCTEFMHMAPAGWAGWPPWREIPVGTAVLRGRASTSPWSQQAAPLPLSPRLPVETHSGSCITSSPSSQQP